MISTRVKVFIAIMMVKLPMLAMQHDKDIDTYEEEPLRECNRPYYLPLKDQKHFILTMIYALNSRKDLDTQKKIKELLTELVQINAYIHRPECGRR